MNPEGILAHAVSSVSREDGWTVQMAEARFWSDAVDYWLTRDGELAKFSVSGLELENNDGNLQTLIREKIKDALHGKKHVAESDYQWM